MVIYREQKNIVPCKIQFVTKVSCLRGEKQGVERRKTSPEIKFVILRKIFCNFL